MDSVENSLRRRLIRDMLLSGAWASLAGSALIVPCANAMEALATQVAGGKSVFRVTGTVRVDGVPATQTTRVFAHSQIETGPASSIAFVVGGDAHLLGENSRVQLEGEGFVESTLRLLTGKLLSIFGPRPSGQSLNLVTTTATVGIRGTGVFAQSGEEVSYICTCFGQVEIRSANQYQGAAQHEQVQSEHHDAPRYVLRDPDAGLLITPAKMKLHTDEEVELVQALLGGALPASFLRKKVS